ncbi:guanyl-specific ribonuclease T1 [Aspergillus heteromorphus CBS 117.55]|uniref:ribonuclease T1 n=1 Tax=Aspergillus heteromorphus CBS 117.55 TaxID=1448321 RepID=A0A317VND9_9EURO|nr:guanyl-specific ribonuclease T1 [Aspergillus heteromorphus CBS 117.55]PWY75445.1 guanyl-specific ribonuclease T1 [Aspergillus heteromorphus CBS 117.55]
MIHPPRHPPPRPLALSTPTPAKRDCAYVCGDNCYTTEAVAAAQADGWKLWEEWKTVGKDEYPHRYEDYEGFDFTVGGYYVEFPILYDGEIFTGATGPGADRVIFNYKDELAGVITHTGAEGDDFVSCEGDVFA